MSVNKPANLKPSNDDGDNTKAEARAHMRRVLKRRVIDGATGPCGKPLGCGGWFTVRSLTW